ncbi:hypothetical protein ACTWQL_23400 [Pseudalkalibacillus sp. R45]|uniref:hypothetical protein n=1 Tax=Pseudalkalibacillus sp. R45 TaxID=3457433 RepID=UPI003FCDC106
MKPLYKNLILLLVCLGLAGCSGNLFSILDQAELRPPEAVVLIGEKEIPHKKGSFCWQSNGQGVCADTAGAEALTSDTKPTSVPKDSLIKINYEEEPSGIHVVYLKDGTEYKRFSDKFDFKMPSEPGNYVIEVLARWRDRGDQFIAFKVKVDDCIVSCGTKKTSLLETKETIKFQLLSLEHSSSDKLLENSLCIKQL